MKRIVVGFVMVACSFAYAQQRKSVDLNAAWVVKPLRAEEVLPEALPEKFEAPGSGWYAGDMPKQVQEFILENGELPDPHVGDNAAEWVPVFEKDWLYCKRFATPDHPGPVSLCFAGLDTEADIILNGKNIAYCNNMHRRWTIPVTHRLNAAGQDNTLMVRFHSPQSVIRQFTDRYGKTNVNPSKYIRKPQGDFSGYLGSRPSFVKMGVFDRVYLDLLPESWFGDVYVTTSLKEDHSSAAIVVQPDVKNAGPARLAYELFSPDGTSLKKATLEAADSFSIPVEKPRLWWPMGYGVQPLYTLKLQLQNGTRILDESTVTVGIRDIRVMQKDEQTGEARFGFIINGKKIFMHGACWAPLEGFTHVWDAGRAEKLLDLMKLGNFNFLRVWGEGSIPGDSLFDRCDREGIVVWMEFMTGPPLHHPLHDAGFVANIRADIEDEIKRLRNRPCIAVWCGGNEHYLPIPSNDGDNTEPASRELFQKIMPELVAQFDPQRYFHPSSPWGGDNWPIGNDPLEGDFHDYSTFRFQPLATVPLFSTEVCMISPYSPHNMQRFMSADEFWPDGFEFMIDYPGKKAWPPGWEKHSLGSAWEKMGRIQDFCDIRNADDACRVFGTAHGQYLQDRYETQRRGVPKGGPDGNRRSWGAAIWRLNDTWPMIYMSAVDYYLEPKIPYYFLKRACEPVLISFEQTEDRIGVWAVNDTSAPVCEKLTVELWTFDGKMEKRITREVNLAATESKRIVDLTDQFHEIWKRREFLVARFGDQVVTHLLWPEKFLTLKQGKIEADVRGDEISLRSDTFIKDVVLCLPDTSGAVFSDNCFNLIPGEARCITLIERAGGKAIEIKGLNSDKIRIEL